MLHGVVRSMTPNGVTRVPPGSPLVYEEGYLQRARSGSGTVFCSLFIFRSLVCILSPRFIVQHMRMPEGRLRGLPIHRALPAGPLAASLTLHNSSRRPSVPHVPTFRPSLVICTSSKTPSSTCSSVSSVYLQGTGFKPLTGPIGVRKKGGCTDPPPPRNHPSRIPR